MTLKIVGKRLLNAEQERLMNIEISMLRRLRHSNLLTMIEELDIPLEWYYVMELFQVSLKFKSHIHDVLKLLGD